LGIEKSIYSSNQSPEIKMQLDRREKSFVEMFNTVGLSIDILKARHIIRFLELIKADNEIDNVLFEPGKPLHDSLNREQDRFMRFMAMTQAAMQRPKHIERPDINDPEDLDVPAAKECAKLLGMVDAITSAEPIQAEEMYICGAFQFRTISREADARQLIAENKVVGVKKVIMSSGFRKLDPKIEDMYEAGNIETEAQMAFAVLKQNADFYNARGIEISCFDAKAQAGDVRARTEDTAQDAANKSAAEVVVLVTNQPFVSYQGMDFQYYFHPRKVMTFGGAAPDSYNAWNYYDAFTRWMYTTSRHFLRHEMKLEPKIVGEVINEYKKKYNCSSLFNPAQLIEVKAEEQHTNKC